HFVNKREFFHLLSLFYYRYNVRWYVAPVHAQKLILFILQRSGKAVVLNFGNIFVVSLECFAMVIIIIYHIIF
ncbi:hypothetical protein ALC60_01974, partial [Trachymyrmex zeteki]